MYIGRCTRNTSVFAAISYSIVTAETTAMREVATICPRPCKLTYDLLTLKVVSRGTCDVGYVCANFSLHRPLCSLNLGPMYATDRRLTSDARQTSDAHHRLMPPALATYCGGLSHSLLCLRPHRAEVLSDAFV